MMHNEEGAPTEETTEVASAPPVSDPAPTPPAQPPLDFEKVEALRKHMMLTMVQMAKVLGTTRVTYSGWVSGKAIRKSNDQKVRAALRRMLKVLRDEEWPKPEVIAMTSEQRYDHLLAVLPE